LAKFKRKKMSQMKKWITGSAGALFLALFVMFAPVRAAVMDALSIFRVSQLNAIRITVGDVEEMAEGFRDFSPSSAGDSLEEPFAVEKLSPDVSPVELNSIDEFTAFNVKLPAAASGEPRLTAVPAGGASLTLHVSAVNARLADIGADAYLPDSYEGGRITVRTPAALIAVYDDVVLGATQMPAVTTEDGVDLALLRDIALNVLPVPSSVAAQLSAIPVDSRNVYLPVLVGISREVNVGGATGYLYGASDLQAVIGAVGAVSGETNDFEAFTPQKDGSVLIWVRDGVIYALAGSLPGDDLLSIARSAQ
jgi:hypothetical protein